MGLLAVDLRGLTLWAWLLLLRLVLARRVVAPLRRQTSNWSCSDTKMWVSEEQRNTQRANTGKATRKQQPERPA